MNFSSKSYPITIEESKHIENRFAVAPIGIGSLDHQSEKFCWKNCLCPRIDISAGYNVTSTQIEAQRWECLGFRVEPPTENGCMILSFHQLSLETVKHQNTINCLKMPNKWWCVSSTIYSAKTSFLTLYLIVSQRIPSEVHDLPRQSLIPMLRHIFSSSQTWPKEEEVAWLQSVPRAPTLWNQCKEIQAWSLFMDHSCLEGSL